MGLTIHGARILEYTPTTGFDLQGGAFTERQFVGHADDIQNVLNVEGPLADSWTRTPDPTDGWKHTLALRYTGSDSNTVTLESEETQLSLYIHPRYIGLNDELKNLLPELARDTSTLSDKSSRIDAVAETSEEADLGHELLLLLISGQETYPFVAWVINYTATVWSGGTTRLNTSSTNAVWLPETLGAYLSGLQALRYVSFDVPIDTVTPAEQNLGYVWGWRKSATRVAVMATGKAVLTETWNSGKYNSKLFTVI